MGTNRNHKEQSKSIISKCDFLELLHSILEGWNVKWQGSSTYHHLKFSYLPRKSVHSLMQILLLSTGRKVPPMVYCYSFLHHEALNSPT
jgi:hypothetical protein